MNQAYHPEDDVLSFIKQEGTASEDFQPLALKVFRYQFTNNKAYQNYCQSIGYTPDTITQWQDIPAIPTNAYKFPEVPVVSFPIKQTQHTFLTSGTTSDQKGIHHFPSLTHYEVSILNMWDTLKVPQTDYAVFLTPSPHDAPHSSLSHMMGTLATNIADQSIWFHTPPQNQDVHTLQNLTAKNTPLILLGTAISFLQLFDLINTPIQLPKGSFALETGGYKGSQRQLTKEELHALFEQKLGLSSNNIINEYSMTELSSQFYTKGINQPHQAPHWTRIQVIDPNTGKIAPDNTPGYLVIYDLANLHSVMAVQTQDIAIAHNEKSFTLLGRDPSALPRGCSRSADLATSYA